jgi:hypothetical protein
MTVLDTRALVEAANRQAIRAPLADVADFLQDVLGSRLVAYVGGVKDTKTVSRWAKGQAEARQESEARLRIAYEIAHLLIEFDSPRIVKSWFIGLNPQLGDMSPAEAIHDGQLKDAIAAARAFITGG